MCFYHPDRPARSVRGRGRPPRYCSDECARVADRTSERGRTDWYGLTRRQFLSQAFGFSAVVLVPHIREAAAAGTLTDRYAAVTDILTQERLALLSAPEDRLARDHARSVAASVLDGLAANSDHDRWVWILRGGAHELIRDTGVDGSTEEELRQGVHTSIWHGEKAIDAYRSFGDKIRAVRALVGTANCRRPFGGDHAAARDVLKAYNIACGLALDPRRRQREDFNSLFHEVAVWYVRVCRERRHDSFENLFELEAFVERLTAERGSEVARSEGADAFLNRWRRLGESVPIGRPERSRIEARIAYNLDQLRRIKQDKLAFVEQPSRLRAEIEYRIDESSDEVLHLVERYADFYRRDPNYYYLNRVAKWARHLAAGAGAWKKRRPLRLDDLPEPIYVTSIHPPLWRSGRDD